VTDMAKIVGRDPADINADLARLQRLADNSKDQADNVHALEASFGAVSTESAKNLAAVEKGPLSPDEMEEMRAFGRAVHG